MQDDLTRLDVVPETGLFDQGGCMTGQLLVMHFPTADLAAIDLQDNVQAQELATHSDRKIGDVPGPGLIGPGGGNRQRLAYCARPLSPAAEPGRAGVSGCARARRDRNWILKQCRFPHRPGAEQSDLAAGWHIQAGWTPPQYVPSLPRSAHVDRTCRRLCADQSGPRHHASAAVYAR